MTITDIWTNAFGTAGTAAFVALAVSFIDSDAGAWLLLITLVWAGIAVGALICDGIGRLFRRLTGLRVRIVIERVR